MRVLRFMVLSSLAACGPHDHHDDPTDTVEPASFALRFSAVSGGGEVGCGTPVAGLGPGGAFSLSLNDLRFYVSNLVFRDAGGEPVAATLDEDAFQLNHPAGQVSLVDLTATDAGACVDGSISFSEGTSRTHEAITGATLVDEVASVSFDVGVPQALMKAVIAENTIEGAPSPLAEMYWSWATGYRHFVLNATVGDGEETGEGYLHIGSTGCAGDGENALESRDRCDLVNTPAVAIDGFNLAEDTIAVDIAALVGDLDFDAPVYNPETWEVIGSQTGLECHSSGMQPDCGPVFSAVGLDLATGAAEASANLTFRRQ